MSSVYNTGPVEMYVGVGVSLALVFLGYSEDGMRIELRETFEDIHSDMLGPRIPTEVQHFQADAMITGDLVRWDDSVLQVIEDRSLGGAGWGVVSRAENGALLLAQGRTYRLLCDAPNVGILAFPNLVAYNFPNAYLHDTMTRRRGARAERVHIIFRALAQFTNIGATSGVPATATLYNSVRTGKPVQGPD